jgi:DNA-binding transcriptional MerR regulator
LKVEAELTKLYYSIGEVAEMFNVSASLIRYWESEFTMLRPKKNRKGDRQFTKKDIDYLERIYTLVKERGFTLDGAKKELRSRKTPLNKKALINKLNTLRSKIEDLHNSL